MLAVAVLHGLPLKNLGGDGALSTIVPYDVPRQWSLAVHRHPRRVDGFLSMSRHLDTSEALVLFDRAESRLSLSGAVPFRSGIIPKPSACCATSTCCCVERRCACGDTTHAAAPLPATRACRWYSTIDSATPAAAAAAANRNTCG